ncbi:MAG: ABC-2 transporter permease [Clostridia bacterium]|nr:ABC-2 transporter permease [Clostridia bacterium]
MKITSGKNPKIEGLIIKDLLQLKTYRKTLISFIVIFSITPILQYTSGGGEGIFNMLPIMITLGFGMFSIASFNYDEAAKADRYIKSLPISSKEIVLSKYILTICATILGGILGILLAFIISSIFAKEYDIEIIVQALGGILGMSIVEAIQIPCIYRFGAEKARMQIFLVMVILFVIGALLVGGLIYWVQRLDIETMKIEALMPLIFAGFTALVYKVSYNISYKIYEKKEF